MAAAAALSFSLTFSSDSQPIQTSPFPTASPCNNNNPKHPILSFHKRRRFDFISSSSSSQSSSTTTTQEASTGASASSCSAYSNLEDSFKPGRFLSDEEVEKLKILQDFRYQGKLRNGSMWVRVMRPEEVEKTVTLLAESFAESMYLPTAAGYVALLRFLVKQYLVERRAVMPHAVTLVGFYRESEGGGEEEEEELAGTVEVCFDQMGANASPPTPTAPKNSPYICNMTVTESLRRRGIGWNLLKASEELISIMSCKGEVYLHCRMIDSAPFNMYTKAGYNIVKTDSILILLMLQRRKHLMYKKLSAVNPSGIAITNSDVQPLSKLEKS